MLKGIKGKQIHQATFVTVVRLVPSPVCMPETDALDLTRAARAWQREGKGVESRRVFDEDVGVQQALCQVLPEAVDERKGPEGGVALCEGVVPPLGQVELDDLRDELDGERRDWVSLVHRAGCWSGGGHAVTSHRFNDDCGTRRGQPSASIVLHHLGCVRIAAPVGRSVCATCCYDTTAKPARPTKRSRSKKRRKSDLDLGTRPAEGSAGCSLLHVQQNTLAPILYLPANPLGQAGGTG